MAGLFVSLYSAVERLLLYQDQSGPAHSAAACRCILLHELCPALHTLLEDGLKVATLASISEFFSFDFGAYNIPMYIQNIDDLMIYLHIFGDIFVSFEQANMVSLLDKCGSIS